MSMSMSMSVIDSFAGTNRVLSNFSNHEAAYGDRWYATAEHAFAAAKTHNDNWMKAIAAAESPTAAKYLGRRAPIRDDWEEVKPQIMLDIVRSKFAHDPALAAHLRDTGDALLIEGNTWGEKYWGRIRPRACAPSSGITSSAAPSCASAPNSLATPPPGGPAPQ